MGTALIHGASGAASPAALACAAAIEDYFGKVVAALDVLRDGLTTALAGALGGGSAQVPTAALLEAAHPLTRDLLDRLPLFGGGFVAAPGFLADQNLYLAWWQGEDQQLLAQSTASGSGDPLDYTRAEWFRVPVETGRAHVTGPFVDYVCSDEYMLTTTAPVVVDGRVLGVVGADTLLDTFEAMMLDTVRDAGATVLNQANRVVLSADPRVPPGRIIPAGEQQRIVCGDLPFVVATSPTK